MQPFIDEERTDMGYVARVNGVVARTAMDDAADIGQRFSDNPTLGPNPFEVDRTWESQRALYGQTTVLRSCWMKKTPIPKKTMGLNSSSKVTTLANL